MDYTAFLVSSVAVDGTLTRTYRLGGDLVEVVSILPGMVLPTQRISLECTCHSQDYDLWCVFDVDAEEVISEYLTYEEAKTFVDDVEDIRVCAVIAANEEPSDPEDVDYEHDVTVAEVAAYAEDDAIDDLENRCLGTTDPECIEMRDAMIRSYGEDGDYETYDAYIAACDVITARDVRLAELAHRVEAGDATISPVDLVWYRAHEDCEARIPTCLL